MRLLLDTHCWLWLVADPERIRRDVVEMLVAEGTDVYVSAATAWGIVIKHALGKLCTIVLGSKHASIDMWCHPAETPPSRGTAPDGLRPRVNDDS
ncbi:hypothetical protein BE08_25935 [Sorangium cellulosum]|uniref:PIN domain-containing protein n=1 Tax=Sorangium cellulosum TaxID=56 RepID=A0A150P3X0_SORCE|nr:hypothetical protein BE08_25935 [Sorangium cellulosum]